MTLATPATTIQEPRDFGQRIAAEYWRKTPHVFSSQGRKNPRCGLCLVPDNGQHRAREPYAPSPTISTLANDAQPGYYHFTATLSCGHGPVGFATPPQHPPKVGDPYNCWDCQRPVDDRNLPPLSEEVRERIEALLPKCPTCGGAIEKIPFIRRTVHSYSAEVDYRSGEILARSEHDQTVLEDPDWNVHYVEGNAIRGLDVECADGHTWFETRLSYERNYRTDEHVWRVLPAEAQS